MENITWYNISSSTRTLCARLLAHTILASQNRIINRNKGFTRQNFSAKNSGGFAQVVFLAIVIIVALAYFNVDFRAIVNAVVENPVVQKIWHIFVVAWGTYIKPLFIYLWTSITGLFK